MAFSNYTDLQASIAEWLNRSDLTTIIPDFIRLAEADMNDKIRHWRMENRATAVANSQFTAIPTDFLEPIRLHLETDQRAIELVSVNEIQRLRQANADISGEPKNYSIVQGEIELFPKPDASYNLELYYYAKIPSLSVSQATNEILTNFPNVYLYGSLLHAAPFLGEDARTQTWASLYQSAIAVINNASDGAKTNSSGRRIKIRSY